ncbi:MAG: patatin-like phospholipase family protein [Burkholderiales bacterium]|nr:patatin-like phospholipase family protein [Burkholderiales bacterium]
MPPAGEARSASGASTLPGQAVLVLQGGGALGAYQAGVYEGLHEAGIEPDWVIGTSIGAINAALIAGNSPEVRLERLRTFWSRVTQGTGNFATVTLGIPQFFVPNPFAWLSAHTSLGVERAAYYSTTPLRETLADLVDLERIAGRHTRLTVGAVNVRSGEMRYFDSRDETVHLDHVLASGALPPAFPAVRIEGEPYWDGGIYSNTPIEAVLDDKPRQDSVIFTVHMWNPEGPEPDTLWQVMGRQKDIQYASRARSHIARQKQIHHLRHVIRELAKKLPEDARKSNEVRELTSWGCGTTMHVVRLIAPAVDGEDHTKDIDFTASGIRARWQAGYADARRMLRRAPWQRPVDPSEGVVIHDAAAQLAPRLAQGVDGFAGRTR